jgi:hypothetical protein
MSAARLAREAMENRLDRLQCAEALVEIMDARRHSVLMPGCAQKLFGHDLTKDGFAARYQGCVVLRRDNKTQVDFAVEDQLTAKRVDDAMNFLTVGTGSRTWAWNSVQPRSGPALGNPIETITPPKTSNAATTLQRITWADFDSALARLGFDPAAPTGNNQRTMSWTIKTPTQKCVFGSIQGQKLPIGDVFTLSGTKKKLTSLDPAGLRHIIDEYVQAGITVVY